jgi:dolichol-phosphate mannosyltransferase
MNLADSEPPHLPPVAPGASPAHVATSNGGPAPLLTVIVPTRDERDVVSFLLKRLVPAVTELRAEILFVDDSDDDTPAEIRLASVGTTVPIRVLHREPGDRAGGLGGAVVAGLRLARGRWALVMDGDLQHPPESAAALARTAMRQDVDIVVGTRYAGAGTSGGLDGAGRSITSSVATRLSKTLFPLRLATVSDPMSGLFAVRRSAVDLDRMHPMGFKVLLELLVRHPSARVAEVAYEFAPRAAGDSKATVAEGLTFARLLLHLRRDVLSRQLRGGPKARADRVRQAARAFGFGLVGATGIVVNTLVLWLAYAEFGLNEAIGATLATEASTTWNFLLVDMLVYRGAKRGSRRGRALRFFALNNLLLLARLPLLMALMWFGLHLLVANAVTLCMLFLFRFLVSDRVIYGATTAGGPTSRDPVRMLVDLTEPAPVPRTAGSNGTRRRSGYLTYRYDVAGVVTIGSQIKLPELEFFRAQWVPDADVDIAVRVGDVGRRAPRGRAAMTEYAEPVTLRYEEHLGRLGANFLIRLGDPVTTEVGPLLAHSPHVVYTNIIEALLRFVMVSRGRMLLHSACVELDGVGVMLSALTDTGKTATVLRLLREHDDRLARRPCDVLPEAADDQRAHVARRRVQRADGQGVAPAPVAEPAALQGRAVSGADAGAVQRADHGDQRADADSRTAAEVHRRPSRLGAPRQHGAGRGALRHRAWTGSADRPGPCLDRAADAGEHGRRLRLPAVPVPRAGRHDRRGRIRRAARPRAGHPRQLPLPRPGTSPGVGNLRLGR